MVSFFFYLSFYVLPSSLSCIIRVLSYLIALCLCRINPALLDAQLFFYKALYLDGEPKLNKSKGLLDYAWVARVRLFIFTLHLLMCLFLYLYLYLYLLLLLHLYLYLRQHISLPSPASAGCNTAQDELQSLLHPSLWKAIEDAVHPILGADEYPDTPLPTPPAPAKKPAGEKKAKVPDVIISLSFHYAFDSHYAQSEKGDKKKEKAEGEKKQDEQKAEEGKAASEKTEKIESEKSASPEAAA
jgi:hypothetical protein